MTVKKLKERLEETPDDYRIWTMWIDWDGEECATDLDIRDIDFLPPELVASGKKKKGGEKNAKS